MTPAAKPGRPVGWTAPVRLPDASVPPPTPEQKECELRHRVTATAPCPACGWSPARLAARKLGSAE